VQGNSSAGIDFKGKVNYSAGAFGFPNGQPPMKIFSLKEGQIVRSRRYLAGVAVSIALAASGTLASAQDMFANAQPRLLTELRITGPAAGRDVQGQDISQDGYIYTLQDQGGAAYIRKFNLSGAQVGTLTAPDVHAHETLFIEDTPSGRYLWTGSDKKSGPRLIRIRESDGAVQFFPIDFSLSHAGETQSQVAVAYDARTGVVALRAIMIPRKQWIFVYRMADIKADSSHARATSSFALTLTGGDQEQPFQGLATDGQYIWVRRGGSDISSTKLLYTYTMSGQIVSRRSLAPGFANAKNEGDKFEPEAISLYRDVNGARYMTMEMESGHTGQNIHRLYVLPDSGASSIAARTPTAFSQAIGKSPPAN
jgi:hypothetical protein